MTLLKTTRFSDYGPYMGHPMDPRTDDWDDDYPVDERVMEDERQQMLAEYKEEFA